MRHVFLVVGSVALLACGGRAQEAARSHASFAARIERLSEPGGFFDTDNLISNETSYLHVMSELRELSVSGGAYVGVGPDQNFSYIAQIRPNLAFVIDIRRDNMLLHLIFKAMFEIARTRVEYLRLLFAKPSPVGDRDWRSAAIDELVQYVDSTQSSLEVVGAARAAVDSAVASFGVELSGEDWFTIDRFHRAFIESGLSLQFRSAGRPPRFYYPAYRELLLERDRAGERANYLVAEDDFQFLKSLQERDLLIPVVGDFAGDHALRAIGQLIAEQGEQVSAFYTSNVEFYLFRGGRFGRYMGNVERLPRNNESVVIRAVFRTGYRGQLPQSVPGYFSTQLLQSLDELVEGYAAGGFRSYYAVVMGRPQD